MPIPVKLAPIVLIFNLIFLYWFVKHILSYILFPFACDLVKTNFHRQMNERMALEVSGTLIQANEIIQDKMNKDTYEKYETFREYRQNVMSIKKMCDYV